MTYSINSINLGDVQTENVTKEAYLQEIAMYMSDSNETFVFDYGGTVKKIIVKGMYRGTIEEIRTFKNAIQNLIQGHQDATAGYPVDYVSDVEGTIKVKIMQFSYDVRVESVINYIEYELRLIEASTTA